MKAAVGVVEFLSARLFFIGGNDVAILTIHPWICVLSSLVMHNDVQDERAMVVLKSINREWRLFWVFEAIGLGFGLAVLAVKLTGTSESVSTDKTRGCGIGQCSLYEWYFVVNVHPFATTVVSLLLNIIVVRPGTFFQQNMRGKASVSIVLFWFCLFCWSVVAFGGVLQPEGELVGVVALVVICTVAKFLVTALTGRRLPNATWFVNNSQHEPHVTPRSSICALWRGSTPAMLFVLVGVPLHCFAGLMFKLEQDFVDGLGVPAPKSYVSSAYKVAVALQSCLECAHDTWLLWGTGIGGAVVPRIEGQLVHGSPPPAYGNPSRSPPASANSSRAPCMPRSCGGSSPVGLILAEVSLTTALLFGWGLQKVFEVCLYWLWAGWMRPTSAFIFGLINLVWVIVLGLLVREATPKSAVFWVAATVIRNKVFLFALYWMHSSLDQTV